jgi:hypothetical protein
MIADGRNAFLPHLIVAREEHQARELARTLGILDAEGADGAFVWTFADPWLPHSTTRATTST